MSRAAILLRLLLIVALILNGVGSAMAGTRMLGETSAGETVAQVVSAAHHGAHGDAGEQPPCHDSMQAPPADTIDGHSNVDFGDSGCCHSGDCSCHCMQQAQAAMLPPALITHQPVHATTVPSMSPAHESPRLPHLIRPPIGQAS